MSRRNELKDRLSRFAEHYKFNPNQLEKGLEAYAVHLFAQEEGLDWVLNGQAMDDQDLDLSPYILRGDDLGVDGLLADAAGNRIVIIQCTTQAKDLEQKLDSFSQVVDRLNNPELVRRAGEPLQELVATLPEKLGDECSVELRFVSSQPLGKDSRLPTVVDSYNAGYDSSGQKITLEIYGSAELLQAEEELANATTGAPIGEVVFSIQKEKTLLWDDDAPRKTLVGLIKGNELADLYAEYKNKLFAANIRLPLVTKNVNPDIRQTAEEEPENFFYYNNGVSAVCKKFDLDGTKVTATGFQIINGAQTVDSLRKALRKSRDEKIYVLFRLTASESYGKDKNFTENIIKYNNTQNPVKAYDFFSNDPIQKWMSNKFKEFSGKPPIPPFYYVHKSGHRPPDAAGKKQLKIDDFAGIRHAFIYGPIASYREPATFFKREERYGEAFGVNGEIRDSWDDETVAEALCAYALTKRIQKIATDVQAKEKELRKTDPTRSILEARYLYRLARYVAALVGVGLREIMPSKLSDYRTLMASEANFDRYSGPILLRARDLVQGQMQARQQAAQLRAEYNFARDAETWTVLKNTIRDEVWTRIEFD